MERDKKRKEGKSGRERERGGRREYHESEEGRNKKKKEEKRRMKIYLGGSFSLSKRKTMKEEG